MKARGLSGFACPANAAFPGIYFLYRCLFSAPPKRLFISLERFKLMRYRGRRGAPFLRRLSMTLSLASRCSLVSRADLLIGFILKARQFFFSGNGGRIIFIHQPFIFRGKGLLVLHGLSMSTSIMGPP
jgi:hypothetical protein